MMAVVVVVLVVMMGGKGWKMAGDNGDGYESDGHEGRVKKVGNQKKTWRK